MSGQDVRSVQFPLERRKGYSVDAVDRFLEDVAQYVDVLRGRLEGNERTERSAMLLLQQAQDTADKTLREGAEQSAFMRAEAQADAREMLEQARAESRQRTAGTEAQIEAAFADASSRLNDLERAIEARRRELALLEAGSARFAADQAARMRDQAQLLLEAAASITDAASPRPAELEPVGAQTATLEPAPVGPPALGPPAPPAPESVADAVVGADAVVESDGDGSDGPIDLRSPAEDLAPG